MKRFALLFCGCGALAACSTPGSSPTPGVDAGLEGNDASVVVREDGGTPPGVDAGLQATHLRVRIENVAPWTVLKSGVQSMKVAGANGPLGSGDAYEISFSAGHGQSVSFASMLGESNDWFFAPGPTGIALYGSDGAPTSGDVTSQVSLWDSGTEVNQEPGVGPDVGPNQAAPDQGAADPVGMVRELGASITLSDGSSFARPAISDMIRVTLTPKADRVFTLRIENVSTAATLVTSAGSRPIHVSPALWVLHTKAAPLFDPGMADRGLGLELIAESGRSAMLLTAMSELSGIATPISPGVFVVHRSGEPLFSVGLADRGAGLEHLAEDGNATPVSDSLASSLPAGASMTGIFNTPVGATSAGPALPGHAFELEIDAKPGDRLSFASMFGMSNDWFFAGPANGIALFDAWGAPLEGSVSDMVSIYDAGTELDSELGVGPNVAPQQAAPDTGDADPIRQVRVVSSSQYGRPASAHVRVSVEVVR